MIRITQVKIDITEKEPDLAIKKAVCKKLKVTEHNIKDISIVKKSIDAHLKNQVKYSYVVDVSLHQEDKILKRCKGLNVAKVEKSQYTFLPTGIKLMKHRPVVVGTGPAGMFCALLLAEHGYAPLVIERGEEVDHRIKKVYEFWNGGTLEHNSNVQFGEGGAGTFSDGKLNTLVKDPTHRNRKVLWEYVNYGAPSEILYLNKPHIGTDGLQGIVKSMRKRIIELGGEVRFQTFLSDLTIEGGELVSIQLNHKEWVSCEQLVLAIGHSSRETFSLLHDKGITMVQKPFAIGVRIEHPQEFIGESQYGHSYKDLPAADYKLTHQASDGRGVYSFCMCPGGFVVNSSSEDKRLVINGMSNYHRDERNANSALVVSVKPEDFATNSPLSGVEFQRKWEELAFSVGKGNIPVQLYGDFARGISSQSLGTIVPNMKGDYQLANLQECLPSYVVDALKEGMCAFDKKIPGFAQEDVVLSGVETRTSSPVRMIRDERYQSNIKGIYPCGEGAGYAGGITSAAMDGIKIFEAIANEYKAIE